VLVLVAAADVPAGSVVDSSMLATAQLPASAAAGLANDPTALVGRMLVVPLVKGEPIGAGMTASRPAARAGHRLVRVSVGSVDVAPDVRVGADVDLVASFPPTASDPRPVATVVAIARVAALERPPGAGASPSIADSPGPGGTAGLAVAIAVTLDCAAADALRVLTARDNARTLRLLAHPGGDAVPPTP
jgi:Flp pilus assembly protein CpaB